MKNSLLSRISLIENELKKIKSLRSSRKGYKISLIEKQIKEIKTEIEINNEKRWFVKKLESINKTLTTYQFLITLVLGFTTIAYVKFVFNISPTESYENVAVTKKLTEFYQEMGDDFRYKGEYDEATKAYDMALKLQPNHSKSILGLAKTKIFDPKSGEKYTDPELVDQRIAFLERKLKDERFSNDFADIDYFKVVNAEERLNFKEQKELLQNSIEKALSQNIKMAYLPYIYMGILCQKQSDFDCSIENYQKAKEIYNSSAVYNNLGYIKFLQFDFEDSEKDLLEANKIRYSALTLVNLGEVNKFKGDLKSALTYFKEAQQLIEGIDTEKSSVTSGTWIFNTPPSKEDSSLLEYYFTTSSISDKKTLINYLLSNTYALSGEFDKAQTAFDNAVIDDKSLEYAKFFIADCFAVSKSETLKIDENTKNWLKTYSQKATDNDLVKNEIEHSF